MRRPGTVGGGMAGVSTLRRWAAVALLCAACWAPSVAWAMPPLVAVAVAVAAEAAGYALTTAVIGSLTLGNVIFISSLVYGVVNAREQKRRARNQARDAYNANLTDRTVTVMSSEAAWQVIYGEAVVGGAQVPAVLTSGERDEFKHVLIVWAAHECEAIVDVLIDGESIGQLDADGFVIGGTWFKGETLSRTIDVSIDEHGQGVLPEAASALTLIAVTSGNGDAYEIRTLPLEMATLEDGVRLTLAPVDPQLPELWFGQTVQVSYQVSTGSPMLRVRHHLGSDDQQADAVLMAELPDEWKTSDRLRGLCYSYFRFNLNQTEFQSGIPQPLTARVRGRKVYDPRTGLTAWSANSALCSADFVRAAWGKRATFNQVIWNSVSTAANACDEALASHDGAPRYTCNGAFRTDQDPDQTLNQLAQSMAGFVTWTGAWYVQAGVYTAPVMALTDADNAGSIELVVAPSGVEVFNGVRGKFFDPQKYDQLTDYTPYQNDAFVAEDGEEKWADLNLPFTDSAWRAHNLARIQVERSRGETVAYPAKRRALLLRPGRRVTLDNGFLGYTGEQALRVIKREARLGQPVTLTLQRDDPSFYDEVDAPASLPSPAANLPSPFVVDKVADLQAASGTATLLLTADGTVISRIRVSCAPSTDVLVTSTGALQIETQPQGGTDWRRHPDEAGTATQAWLTGLQEGLPYLVRARWRNGIGATGDWAYTGVLHLGKMEPPRDVTGLRVTVVTGGLQIDCDANPDADHAATHYHLEADWHDDTEPLHAGETRYLWPWPPSGSYVLLAKHRDRSGNWSSTAARLVVRVNADSVSTDDGAVIVPQAGAPVVTIAIQQADYVLSWTAVEPSFPLMAYLVSTGETLETATLLDRTQALQRRATVDWSGERRFWVQALDIAGNLGVAGSASYTVPTPTAGSVEVNSQGQVVLRFTRIEDPQIEAWELRQGASFDAGTLVAETTGGDSFELPLATVAGRTFWIAGRYKTGGYTLQKTRFDFTGTQLPAPTGLSWRVSEPDLVWSWSATAGAAQYLVLWEDSGVTTVRVTTVPEVATPIPRGDAVFRLVAVASNGAMSPFVDEELELQGQYALNELVALSLDLDGGRAVNLAIPSASTVRRASVRGIDATAPYAAGWNDGDLFATGDNLAAVPAAAVADVPAAWFRDGWWREKNGYFESGVYDLGAVLTGRLAVALTKTVTWLGDAPVADWDEVLAQHLADATVTELVDHRAFLSVALQVASDSPLSASWRDVGNGDWVTGRYVRLVIRVEMASPLTEVLVTAGQIVLDVPDLVETGSAAAVTTAGTAVAFVKHFHVVHTVLATARGAPKAQVDAVSAAGCTLRTDSATPTQVDYFVKGY